MQNGTLLITGGNGFVGSAVARAWRSAGGTVIVIARSDLSSRAGRVDHSVHAESLSPEVIAEAVNRFVPDVVLHAAGTASVASSLGDPAADFSASVGTLQAVLEGVRSSRHRPRVLYPSSAAVYGEPDSLPVHENAPIRPLSPYGHHKAIAELLAREYAVSFEVPVLVFRLFSLFGPHQRRLLVWELFQQFQHAERVTLRGTGDETRDFLHEDDLGTLLMGVLPKLREPYAILNLATGRATRVRELAELLSTICASPKQISFAGGSQIGNPVHWAADTRKLQDMVPDSASGAGYDLAGRLRATIAAWMREPRS